jgi:hypothetical protein
MIFVTSIITGAEWSTLRDAAAKQFRMSVWRRVRFYVGMR